MFLLTLVTGVASHFLNPSFLFVDLLTLIWMACFEAWLLQEAFFVVSCFCNIMRESHSLIHVLSLSLFRFFFLLDELSLFVSAIPMVRILLQVSWKAGSYSTTAGAKSWKCSFIHGQ